LNNYDSPINLDTENSISLIVEQIKPNSVILEFGPARGRMTKYLSNELGCSVYIVEIDREAFEIANQYAIDGLCGDIEDYEWLTKFKNIKFDYIIFADVLEHLIDPKEVLIKSKKMLAKGGRIITSIPNIAHNSIIIDLINNKFSYSETGILDSTHLRFFTYYSLQQLFNDCDLIIEDEKVVGANMEEYGINNSYQSISNEQAEILRKRELAYAYQFVFKMVDKKFYYKNKDNIKIKKVNMEEPVGSSISQGFFIDTGHGFNENSKITKRITLYDNKFFVNVDLSQLNNIKGLRFDPCEYACKVKVDKISSNIEDLQAIPANTSYIDGDIDVFMHRDPIYILNSKFINQIKYVEISGEIIRASAYELEVYYSNLFIDNLQNSNSKINSLTEKNNTLNIEVEEKSRQIELLNEKNSSLIIDMEEKDNKISLLNEINSGLNNKVKDLIINIEEKSNEVEKLNSHLSNINNELTTKTNELYTMIQEKELLKTELDTLYNSKSWKITKPLRFFYSNVIRVVNRLSRGINRRIKRKLILTDLDLIKSGKHYNTCISVVIPSYNGEFNMSKLLDILNRQKGIDNIEIIVIDSGSKDSTVKICEANNVNLIQISQSEFSHSYARNLGASKAQGDYILFMTQDALPTNEYWIYNMLTPIIKYKVVAVSCTEKPRENCELAYLVESENFARYLGVYNNDKIGILPKIQNYESLRINGQLNDISCLIVKSIFYKFRYRGDYAEDLEMGVRLIKAGYKIAIISSEQVIHSHNRPCGYYLKRAIVDSKNLKKIFPDFSITLRTRKSIISAIIFAYYKVICLLDHLGGDIVTNQTILEFFKKISDYWNMIGLVEDIPIEIMQYNKSYSDEVVDNFLKSLVQIYNDKYAKDTYILNHIIHFINNTLILYVNNHYTVFTNELKNQIIDTIFKRFVSVSGNEISLYLLLNPQDGDINLLVDELQRGV